MAIQYKVSYASRLSLHHHILWTAGEASVGKVSVPEYRNALIVNMPQSSFNRNMAPLKYGRFYPAQILGLYTDAPAGIFRVTGIGDSELTADFNHPLAGRDVNIEETAVDSDIAAVGKPPMLLEWAGMEAPLDELDTDFSVPQAFERMDASDDELFYEKTRKVIHIDPTCVSRIKAVYSDLISHGDSVLDLMSSWRSHLPDGTRMVTGLGMNAEEMADNPQLRSHVVHNLNRSPRLPFSDGIFDAVVNTVSIEYLTEPYQVFAEVRRVLKPGGLAVVTFSNRYFPPKAARFWTELHPAERPGWVLQLLHAKGFSGLHCHVERGLMRSPDDRYAGQVEEMDPLFAVWGNVSAI